MKFYSTYMFIYCNTTIHLLLNNTLFIFSNVFFTCSITIYLYMNADLFLHWQNSFSLSRYIYMYHKTKLLFSINSNFFNMVTKHYIHVLTFMLISFIEKTCKTEYFTIFVIKNKNDSASVQNSCFTLTLSCLIS